MAPVDLRIVSSRVSSRSHRWTADEVETVVDRALHRPVPAALLAQIVFPRVGSDRAPSPAEPPGTPVNLCGLANGHRPGAMP